MNASTLEGEIAPSGARTFSTRRPSANTAIWLWLALGVAGYLFLKGGRVHLLAELNYRWTKFRVNRMKRRFDVYEGGRRADDVDRRVH